MEEELIANIHYCLTRVWDEKGTLDWWSDRWLVAIPKKEQDVTKVGDLRPLILVDTIRKLWCKILLQRILEVWKRNDVLRHAQHGFCAGRSTMTASLMFINMLEEAIEKGEVLHTCSWDITRAFDSVSKNVMRMAWTRLGVPQEWADWLVKLDETGMTAVRTPHAAQIWNKHGRKGFTCTKSRKAGVTQRDGRRADSKHPLLPHKGLG